MKFVSDNVAARPQPTHNKLRTHLQAHSDLFGVDKRFTFRQVFIDPKKRGKDRTRDTAQLLT
jgi:hypothetical protein